MKQRYIMSHELARQRAIDAERGVKFQEAA